MTSDEAIAAAAIVEPTAPETNPMDIHRHARPNRRQALIQGAALLAATLGAAPRMARAQAWPTKPIRVLVPFPTSSPPDISSRLVAGHLSTALGQTVFVENKPGAIGLIAMKELLRQPADGYTLLCMVMPLVTTHALLPAQAIDLQKELAPIVRIDTAPSVLVVPNDLPANSAPELVALMKAKPNGFSFGSGGNGTPAHLAGELFMLEQKVKATHVPYAQFAQVVPDLISGRLQFMFLTASVATPLVTSGKVKALGVAGGRRLTALPNVPTLSEQGLGDFDTSNWTGFAARAGTPPEIIARLNKEVVALLARPEVIKQLEENGATPAPSTPEQFAQHIAREGKRWTEVIRQAGIVGQ